MLGLWSQVFHDLLATTGERSLQLTDASQDLLLLLGQVRRLSARPQQPPCRRTARRTPCHLQGPALLPTWRSRPPAPPPPPQFYPAPARKPIRETNVERLMRLGDKYNCPDVIAACEQYLLQVRARHLPCCVQIEEPRRGRCSWQPPAAAQAPGPARSRPQPSFPLALGFRRTQVALPSMERSSSSDPAAIEHSRTRMFEWMSMAQSYHLEGLEAKCAGGRAGLVGWAAVLRPGAGRMWPCCWLLAAGCWLPAAMAAGC